MLLHFKRAQCVSSTQIIQVKPIYVNACCEFTIQLMVNIWPRDRKTVHNMKKKKNIDGKKYIHTAALEA